MNVIQKIQFVDASKKSPSVFYAKRHLLIADTSCFGIEHSKNLEQFISEGGVVIVEQDVANEVQYNKSCMAVTSPKTGRRAIIDNIGTRIMDLAEERGTLHTINPENRAIELVDICAKALPKYNAFTLSEPYLREWYSGIGEMIQRADDLHIRIRELSFEKVLNEKKFSTEFAQLKKSITRGIEQLTAEYETMMRIILNQLENIYSPSSTAKHRKDLEAYLSSQFKKCLYHILRGIVDAHLKHIPFEMFYSKLAIRSRIDKADKSVFLAAYEYAHGNRQVVIYSADKDIKHLLEIAKYAAKK